MEEKQCEVTTEIKNKLINEILQEYQNQKVGGYIKNGVIKLLFQSEDDMNKRKYIINHIHNKSNSNSNRIHFFNIKEYVDKKRFNHKLNCLRSYNSYSNILNMQKDFNIRHHNHMNSFIEKYKCGENELPKIVDKHCQRVVGGYADKMLSSQLKGFKYKINNRSKTMEKINCSPKKEKCEKESTKTKLNNHFLMFNLRKGGNNDSKWDNSWIDCKSKSTKKMDNKTKFYFYLKNRSLQNISDYYK